MKVLYKIIYIYIYVEVLKKELIKEREWGHYYWALWCTTNWMKCVSFCLLFWLLIPITKPTSTPNLILKRKKKTTPLLQYLYFLRRSGKVGRVSRLSKTARRDGEGWGGVWFLTANLCSLYAYTSGRKLGKENCICVF